MHYFEGAAFADRLLARQLEGTSLAERMLTPQFDGAFSADASLYGLLGCTLVFPAVSFLPPRGFGAVCTC